MNGIFFNKKVSKSDDDLKSCAMRNGHEVDDYIIVSNPDKNQSYAFYNGRKFWNNPNEIIEEE